MAARKRCRLEVDYAQLNALSSVVLYDTKTSKKRSKSNRIYDVERIIERRNVKHDYEYLIKWQGWPMQDCSWEPSENLPEHLIRGYENPPKPSDEKLQEAGHHFTIGILSALKSSSMSPFYVNMKLDVWRFLTYQKGTASEHRRHVLYAKKDFCRFKANLPDYWWYYLDHHGEGKALDFPIKIKPVVSWSPIQYIVKSGKLVKASRYPVEKLCITIAKCACNIDNIDNL